MAVSLIVNLAAWMPFFDRWCSLIPEIFEVGLGVGGMVSILGDVLKSWAGPFLFQDISMIKQNPKEKMNFMHFWRFAPQKTQNHYLGLEVALKIRY